MINRFELVSRHNVKLDKACYDSPLSVGNGEFVFTADVTGMQTLYQEYEAEFPLCTMSNFGWHTENDAGRAYELTDLEMTEYQRDGITFHYPVKKTEKNERIYDWLRVNAHKVNLYRLRYEFGDKTISEKQITNMRQELDLYHGVLGSAFKLNGREIKTVTVCDSESNRTAFDIVAAEGLEKELSVVLDFSYGSPTISGADWKNINKHASYLMNVGKDRYLINRVMDDLAYQVSVTLKNAELYQESEHGFRIAFTGRHAQIVIDTGLHVEKEEKSFEACMEAAKKFWRDYWQTTGLIDFGAVNDPRACELERREILSLYLLRLQCAGTLPPAETGLSCNSWYGKFHMEMHIWHSAFLPLYSQGRLLEKSLVWYKRHLKQARENAARNKYKGARWPKMVDYRGIDSPSPIAPLLIWQQPHIIFMLELLYQEEERKDILEEYFETVWETAEFMLDFAEWDEEKQVYELRAPLIPVQETHAPMDTLNPAFELEYWKEMLEVAKKWAVRLGKMWPESWTHVIEHMALPAVKGGVYLAHENAKDTFVNHAKDHPSMLMACGLLKGERLDKELVKNTIQKVLDVWDFNTSWGWDFAVMAMSAVRVGLGDQAVDLLLKDTQKNEYVVNGHNRQGYRKDLPLYLPGNGSFLYALAVMAAGYAGKEEAGIGFPKDWKVAYENIKVLY